MRALVMVTVVLGMVVPGSAAAKKVKFTHVPLEAGEKVVHDTRLGLDMDMSFTAMGESEQRAFRALETSTTTFDVGAAGADGTDFSVTFTAFSEEKTDPSTDQLVTNVNPLQGRTFEFTAGEPSPDPGLMSRGEVLSQKGVFTRFVLPTEMLEGGPLRVGEPVLGFDDVLLGGLEDGEMQSASVTLAGVRKVDGKKLAVFDLMAVLVGGDAAEPKMKAEVSGELLVDPKTSRVMSFGLEGPMTIKGSNAGGSMEGTGKMLVTMTTEFPTRYMGGVRDDLAV